MLLLVAKASTFFANECVTLAICRSSTLVCGYMNLCLGFPFAVIELHFFTLRQWVSAEESDYVAAVTRPIPS